MLSPDRLRAIAASESLTAMRNALVNVARQLDREALLADDFDPAEAVLPCPFCDGKAQKIPAPSTLVECGSCGAAAFYRWWNLRGTHDKDA